MLTATQINDLSSKGFTDSTILEVDAFLRENKGEFRNLADIGGGDFRLMYKLNGITECLIKPYPRD
jgi:hypothetical protein